MKILLNRSPVRGPWGGGNLFVEACYDILPSLGVEVVSSFEDDIDVILMCDPRPRPPQNISINEILAYKKYSPTTKLVHRVNDTDIARNTDSLEPILVGGSKYVDHAVFISKWLRDYYYNKGWACKDNTIIYNGVADYYCESEEKIDNGKINIVTHHWSANRMKGFDIYEAIDDWVSSRDDFTFTYIGRENGTFKNTEILGPFHGEEIAKRLKLYDVYVSAAKYEAMGNHITESLGCNLSTYGHVDGGGVVELVGKNNVYESWEELETILLSKKYLKNSFKPSSWVQCMHEFKEVFDEVVV